MNRQSKLKRKSELVKLKFVAKVNSLGVVLTENGKKLAQFAILDTQADLTMKDNTMLVQVHIPLLLLPHPVYDLRLIKGISEICTTY